MASPSQDRLFGSNSSLAIKAPCVAGTTANITLSGQQTIDGVAVVTGDRVLVKDQTNEVENGIYIANTSAWQRAPDFDGSRDVLRGALVTVAGGTSLNLTIWVLTSGNPIIINTSDITFEMTFDEQDIPPLTGYPYVIGWVAPTLDRIVGLTYSFPAITVVFEDRSVDLPAWTHTFTQGGNYFVWVNHDGSMLYDDAFAASGGWTRYDGKCPLAQVITWPLTSLNTGIWAVWTECDTRAYANRHEKVQFNANLLLDDYYVFPHNKTWAAMTVYYRDCVLTSDKRLYLVMRPGTLDGAEPDVPTLAFEPYGYSGWGDFQWGTAVIRYVGLLKHEGCFRQGIISNVHNIFGLEAAALIARMPEEISSLMAPYLWEYVKNVCNRSMCTVWQAATAYYLWNVVTGDYVYEGWQWECQTDPSGVSGATCAFLTFALQAASFTIGAGATEWTSTGGYTGGGTLVHAGASTDITYNTAFSASTEYVVSFEVVATTGSPTVQVYLGTANTSITVRTGVISTCTITSSTGSPKLKLTTSGTITIDNLVVYQPPVPGTTTKVDNTVTWKCVGRTSYNKPGGGLDNVNFTIPDWDVLGHLIRSPDSHDAAAYGLIFTVNQLREGGNLPDEYYTGLSNQWLAGQRLTYQQVLQQVIWFNCVLQFRGNLMWGAQYGLYTNGTQIVYPFQLCMDSMGDYCIFDSYIKVEGDPRSATTAATLAYFQGFQDATVLGGIQYWYDLDGINAGAFTWVLDENGAKIAFYDPPEVYDTSLPSYPWVMAQFSATLYGIPLGFDRWTLARAYAQRIFPDWWKRSLECAPFLVNFGHLALCMLDYTDLTRNEILNMVEVEKLNSYGLDVSTQGLANTRMLNNLCYYLMILYRRVLPFNVSQFPTQTPKRCVLAMADANRTLTAAQSRVPVLEATGVNSALRDIIVSQTDKPAQWTVFANVTGGFGVRVKGSSGTGITIADGKRAIVYADGTNVVRVTPDT